MSASKHRQAHRVLHKARKMRALADLLAKIAEINPKAIVKAWEEVNLVSHKCPVCGAGGLGPNAVIERDEVPTVLVCDQCCTRFDTQAGI